MTTAIKICVHKHTQVDEYRNAAPFPLNYGQRTTTCLDCGESWRQQLGSKRGL